MKILLPVDGSDYTKRMLAWLATHDDVLAKGASFSFITVVPPAPPRVMHFIDRATLDGYYGETAKQVLDPIAEFARRHGWQFDTRSPVGHAAQEIVKAASEDRYDLVVMGSHGHSPVVSVLMGSVAQRVLASCQAPVLIIR
jgi:nucleotide-binding universal stress UspA family protein